MATAATELRKEDTPRAPTPPSHNQALSLDQVSADPDELIELRGEGRYFGVTDPELGDRINAQQLLGQLCSNCHRRGHSRAKCKTVVCHKCGKIDDHYESKCPTHMVCYKCGGMGHHQSECTVKHAKRKYCQDCETFDHGSNLCPLIWRSYRVNGSAEPKRLPNISCYNCGSSAHYGDECGDYRHSPLAATGLAFLVNNLPRSLRRTYFDQVDELPPKPKRQNTHFLFATPLPNGSRSLTPSNGRNNHNQRNFTRFGHINNNNNTSNGRDFQALKPLLKHHNHHHKPAPQRLGTISRPSGPKASAPKPLRLGKIKLGKFQY